MVILRLLAVIVVLKRFMIIMGVVVLSVKTKYIRTVTDAAYLVTDKGRLLRRMLVNTIMI